MSNKAGLPPASGSTCMQPQLCLPTWAEVATIEPLEVTFSFYVVMQAGCWSPARMRHSARCLMATPVMLPTALLWHVLLGVLALLWQPRVTFTGGRLAAVCSQHQKVHTFRHSALVSFAIHQAGSRRVACHLQTYILGDEPGG
jgi:hypothetical protein